MNTKNKEPEYRILKFKGTPPNNKLLVRVTDGIIPDPKQKKTLIIEHNQIIAELIPIIGIPKIKHTRKHKQK
jgi:hypothetical protein